MYATWLAVGIEHHAGIGEPAALPRLDRGAAASECGGGKSRSENERARESVGHEGQCSESSWAIS